MAKRPNFRDELSDDEAVEMTPLMATMAEQEAKKRAKTASREEDDDDDFDDDEDDSDDDISDDDDDDDSDDDGSDDSDDDDDADEDDDEDSDDDDDDDEPSLTRIPKVTRKGKDAAKGKKTAKERIEELAAARRKAEAEAFAAEQAAVEERRKREELENRIAALEAGGGSTKKVEKPDPNKFKYGEVDSEYIDAMVEWKLSEERAEFQREQRQTLEQERLADQEKHYRARLNQINKAGAKKFKDFDETVNGTKFPPAVAKDILDSDFGVDISYFLGKNISKLREISNMTDAERAREFGRLEERFSASASAGKKRTKAPDTPGRKARAGKKAASDSKYGPENQDDFDRAFFGR